MLMRSIILETLTPAYGSRTSVPALLTIIEILSNLSSCGNIYSAFYFIPSFTKSATTISTSHPGYFVISYDCTSFNFPYLRDRMIILNPSFANWTANSFPIPRLLDCLPSEEPVTSTQLFSPYIFLKFCFFLNKTLNNPLRIIKNW